MGGTRKKTLKVGDLFIRPDFNETAEIAIDADGRKKRLDIRQLESIRNTGEFEVKIAFSIEDAKLNISFLQVDSIQFPAQKHRWILSRLLMKGKRKSFATYQHDLAKALYCLRKKYPPF